MIFTVAIQGVILTIIALQSMFLSKREPESLKAAAKALSYFLLSLFVVAVFRSFWLSDFTQRQCYNCDVGKPSYNLAVMTSLGRSLQAFSSHILALEIGLIALSLLGLTLLFYKSPKQGIFLGCWLVLSVLVTSLGLWFIAQFYHERYTIWGLPAFLLAVAYGVISLADFIGRIVRDRYQGANVQKVTRVTQLALVGLILMPIVTSNVNQIQQIPRIKQAWPLGQLQEATSKIASEADNQETIIAIGLPARLLRFYLDLDRPDLAYLDENSFVERQAVASLPPKLTGRWYVFPAPVPFNIPERWIQALNYWRFNDLIIIHFQDTCTLATCLDETKTLLAEISKANPNTPLATRISGVMTGLTLLFE